MLKKLEKKGIKLKKGYKDYILSDLDTSKKGKIEELKNAEYNDLDDMVFRMQLTFHEVAEVLDTKYIDAKSTGYNFSSGLFEVFILI